MVLTQDAQRLQILNGSQISSTPQLCSPKCTTATRSFKLYQKLAIHAADCSPEAQDGVRLGEQGGDMLSHVHRREEVSRGDYGVHEGTPQVRS